jgi:hypothetical protein
MCAENTFSALRRHVPGQLDDAPGKRQPVKLVHVDQTAASAAARVHRHLPASDAPDLLKRRFQVSAACRALLLFTG